MSSGGVACCCASYLIVKFASTASDELFAQLRSLQATQRTAQAAFDKRQQRLNAILSACDSQADTMSRLFLEAHAQVSELEARVTRAERAKRKELSETY